MHVIVVGCGRVGSELAVRLQHDGHSVAVMDKSAGAFRRLPEDWPGETVVGFGFDRDDLAAAGVDRAGALAAVTSGDNSNILTARIARETFQIPNVVARIYDPRRALIYQRLGIPTVATVTWTTDQVVRRLFPDRSITEYTDATGEIDFIERTLPDGWVGMRLGGLVEGDRFRPVLVTRAGQAKMAVPELVGQVGDVLLMAVRSGAAEELERRLKPDGEARGPSGSVAAPAGSGVAAAAAASSGGAKGGGRAGGRDANEAGGAAMKVAIAGAGNVGTSIASDLHEAGHDVLIIEQDAALVGRLRSSIDIRWFEGDACEVSTLQRAGLADVDVVVAATGDDEDNLVVSLLAKMEFAVPRVVARVNHPKNQWLFNETWGVDVSVSTPHLLTALVEEAVSVGALVRILQLAHGEARLVEVTLADDSPAKGMSLSQLEMPRDATIVAVVRDDRVVVPHGDTVLYASDEVIALVTEESEGMVKSLLVGGQRGPLAAGGG